MTTRILLVDDHDVVREGLRALIEREESFEVVGEAASGREAVRLTEEIRPDVVVMDLAMRDMNGIEATRQIRSRDSSVHVVALSSHSEPRYVTAALEAGVSGYVLKANAFHQLARAIAAAARGVRYLCIEVTGSVIDQALRHGDAGSAQEVLGPREREVLQLLAEGLSSSEIAARMGLSTSTVETHRRNIMRKLDLHGVADLTKYAVREGLTSLEPGPRRRS